jgi:hypothetical protein
MSQVVESLVLSLMAYDHERFANLQRLEEFQVPNLRLRLESHDETHPHGFSSWKIEIIMIDADVNINFSRALNAI